MTNTMPRRSKNVRIVASLARLAALLVVAAGLAASRAIAWDRNAGDTAVPWDPTLSAPLEEPLIPVLPGGVVGPAIDVDDGRLPSAARPDAARQTAGDAMPGGQQPRLVPAPPPETWEQAVESRASLTKSAVSDAIDSGRGQRQRIGIALGIAGVIGIVAVMAAVRGSNRRSASPSPVSVFRNHALDHLRQREAGHERLPRPGVQQAATRDESRTRGGIGSDQAGRHVM